VIPFSIDKEQAVEAFLTGRRRSASYPAAFFQRNRSTKLTGVYFPYWLVDCDAVGKTGREGTKVRTWTAGDTRYVETQYFQVIREGAAAFSGNPEKRAEKFKPQAG
jgi:hypothetical protein